MSKLNRRAGVQPRRALHHLPAPALRRADTPRTEADALLAQRTQGNGKGFENGEWKIENGERKKGIFAT